MHGNGGGGGGGGGDEQILKVLNFLKINKMNFPKRSLFFFPTLFWYIFNLHLFLRDKELKCVAIFLEHRFIIIIIFFKMFFLFSVIYSLECRVIFF